MSARSFVASRISVLVKVLLLNEKKFGFCSIRSSGRLLDGLIFSTVLVAMLAKNLLKLQAISCGSSKFTPFTVRFEMSIFVVANFMNGGE